MKKKKKDDLEQYRDVRVANMNVEGMPWYDKNQPGKPSSALTESPDEAVTGRKETTLEDSEPLSKKETGRLILTSMLAAMLVAGIFLGAFFLLLLFCIKVWFA